MPCNKLKGNCKISKMWLNRRNEVAQSPLIFITVNTQLTDWHWLIHIMFNFPKKKHAFLYIMSSDWLIWQSTVNDATMLRSWKRLTRKQQLKCMHFHSYFKFGFKIIIKDLLSEINLIVWLYVKKLIAIFILKFYFCIVW